MSSKKRLGKTGTAFLAEVERARANQQWDTVRTLANKAEATVPTYSGFQQMLLGEYELEVLLGKCAPRELREGSRTSRDAMRSMTASLAGIAIGQFHGPQAAIGYFDRSLSLANDQPFYEEAKLLQARAYLAADHFEQAITAFKAVDENCLDTENPRIANMIMQSYACLGMAIEGAKYGRNTSIWAGVISSSVPHYKAAVELAKDRCFYNQAQTNMDPVCISDCEFAAQRYGIALFEQKEEKEGLDFFRSLLQAKGITVNFRATIVRLLGRYLARLSPGINYVPPTPTTKGNNKASHGHEKSTVYVPQSDSEEALLLILLDEAASITLSENDSSDAKHERYMSVYESLGLILTPREQYNPLVDSCERGIALTFGDNRIWWELSQALVCAGLHQRALLVTKHCIAQRPSDPLPLIMAAHLCLEKLNNPQEALELATKAITYKDLKESGLPLCAKHLCGRAHFALSQQKELSQKVQHQRDAIEFLSDAAQDDPNNAEIFVHLAQVYADMRDIPKAIQHVQWSLDLDQENKRALVLYTLLLSASNRNIDSLAVCEAAMDDHPLDHNLMIIAARLNAKLGGPQSGLEAYKAFITQYPMLFSKTSDSLKVFFDGVEHTASMFHSLDSEIASETNTTSAMSALTRPTSVAPNELKPKEAHHPHAALMWCDLSQMFSETNQFDDALKCITEAKKLSRGSDVVEYYHGLWFEKQGKLDDAVSHYELSITINPQQVDALVQLGSVMQQQGQLAAESYLTSATTIDPTCAKAWYYLGLLLKSKNKTEAASNCFLTAADLARTEPILPFSVVPFQTH